MGVPVGYKHSVKALRKISKSSKERWRNLEYKRVVSKAVSRGKSGIKFSEEHKQHLKDNHVGRTGKSHSIEQRERISKTLKGHPGATNQPALVRHPRNRGLLLTR